MTENTPREVPSSRMEVDLVEAEFAVLLVRLTQRDAMALAELYDRYSSRLYGIALAWTDQYSAEQLVEHTFFALWKKVGGWDRSKGGSFAYLFGIMICEARSLSIPVDRSMLIGAFGLQRWADRLAPSDKAVFEAIHVKGLSIDEAARTLNGSSKEIEDRIGKVLHELLQHAR